MNNTSPPDLSATFPRAKLTKAVFIPDMTMAAMLNDTLENSRKFQKLLKNLDFS